MSFAIFAMLFYVIALLLLSPMLVKVQTAEKFKRDKSVFLLTAFIALCLHLINLLDLSAQNGDGISIMQASSFVSLIMALISTFAVLCRVRTLWTLLPIMYGFALINVAFATFLPHQRLAQHHDLFFHIVLSLVSYAVCFIAMLYSIQIYWIERRLKRKKITFSPLMPPLMLAERHFFRVLFSGEILLTATLISGAFVLVDYGSAHNIQKALFTFFAWLVFGQLLIGRWKWHWNGQKMVSYCVSGMILLSIGYAISRAMLT
ncbi:MAG: cytochrome c biogenesis protein CcsA [Pasteurellaceae bacterium]|nr:cytochrome c biogenesis protein CcsA [Pasteurellaceae bacterium]